MKKVKTAGNWLAAAFRPSLLFGGASLCAAAVLWFQLGSLVPGFSSPEVATRTGSSSLPAIVDNPLWLPHKAGQAALQELGHHGPWAMRSVSALTGLIMVGAFYYVLAHWYSRRVAVLGSVLFLTSSWFLHTARLGTEAVTCLLLFAAVAVVVWLERSRASFPAVAAAGALVVCLLYIPGMLWFVVPAALWQTQRIARALTKQRIPVTILLGLISIAALVPLVWALYRDPSLIADYTGLPAEFPDAIQYLKQIALVPIRIFIRGPDNPVVWVGHVALIDWFGSIMFIIGIVSYLSKHRLDRSRALIVIGILGTLLAGLGGAVDIAILMPFTYLVVASGIAAMLRQWFEVFPINPVARSLGATVMTIAVLMSAYYNVMHYFIAWPAAPATKAVFQQKP